MQSNSTALGKGQTISESSHTVHPSCSDSQSTITKRFMENRDSKTHEALKTHKSKNNTNTQRLFKRTRYIPLHTRRMVFQRADYCCEFTGPNKERCESQFQLEIDHFIKPYSQGGDHSLDNLKLLST